MYAKSEPQVSTMYVEQVGVAQLYLLIEGSSTEAKQASDCNQFGTCNHAFMTRTLVPPPVKLSLCPPSGCESQRQALFGVQCQ